MIQKKPAFFLAVTFTLAASFIVFRHNFAIYLFSLLWLLFLCYQRSWSSLCLFFATCVYSFFITQPVSGQSSGIFSISSLQPHATPFYKGLLYKGVIYFEGGRMPCQVFYKGNSEHHPPAHCDYLLQGYLMEKQEGTAIFKPQEWTRVPSTFSLAEMRYQMKERLKNHLQTHLSSDCASFLGSLLTGDVEDRQLRYEFGRVGLQHLLAISGFHFAILLSLFSFVSKRLFPQRISSFFLLIAITIYFLFIGSSPAVQRSWFVCVLYLCALCFKRNSCPKNLLGCGCILEILIDPRVVGHLGFQLSFLSTAGILFLYSPLEMGLRRFFPKRNREEIQELTLFSKLTYLVTGTLRRALSLNFAVNLAILPLLLYHFHKFPLLSLIYNLFIPPLVGGAMFLLSLCLLLPPLFPLCDFFTKQILDLIANPPLAIDYSLRIQGIATWNILLYLLILLSVAMVIDDRKTV